MIRTSKAPVSFPVPWNKAQVLYFRPGDIWERGEFEADMTGLHRAGQVYAFQLREAFEAGVVALLKGSPEDASQIVEWSQAEESDLSPDEAASLAVAREAVAEHWPAYRALQVQ